MDGSAAFRRWPTASGSLIPQAKSRSKRRVALYLLPPLSFFRKLSCLFLLSELVWIVIRAGFVAAAFGNSFRSQIIHPSSRLDFRDPDSRFRLLTKHRSVSRKRLPMQSSLHGSLVKSLVSEGYGWGRFYPNSARVWFSCLPSGARRRPFPLGLHAYRRRALPSVWL